MGALTILKTPFVWVAVGGLLLVWGVPSLWSFISSALKRG